MFEVGDEVVCVDAGPIIDEIGEIADSPLVLGAHYTIMGILPEGSSDINWGRCWRDEVLLVEVKNVHGVGFWIGRFRKVERKRDWQSWLASQPTEFEEPKRVPGRVGA